MPAGAAQKRKQGFDVPISDWQRGALRDGLNDYLGESSVRRRGLFRQDSVGSMVSEHLRGDADHGERLWLLMALEGWMQAVLDRRPADTLR